MTRREFFAAGAGLVVASFAVSSLVVAFADWVAPPLVLPFGMITYAAKYAAMVLLLVMIGDSGWAGRVPMGIGVMVLAVGWAAAQVTWVLRRGPFARPGP